MTTRPENVVTPQSPSTERTESRPPAIHRLEVAILQCRIAELERELEAEQERRQAVVDRYERLLDKR